MKTFPDDSVGAITGQGHSTRSLCRCAIFLGGAVLWLALPAMGQSYTITTVVGGSAVSENVAATTQQIAAPRGMLFDTAGNLYVTEQHSHRVRRITPAGIISTFAGTGVAGFSGDGGPATAAMLNTPSALAMDAGENLYITDAGNNLVRRVTPAGTITTAVGRGYGFSGDGGPAIDAELSSPRGLAWDSNGNLYVSDTQNNRVRRVNPAGIITTFAGNGTEGSQGDGGPCASAELAFPEGLYVDATGLYIAEGRGSRIRRVDLATTLIATVVGNGTSGYTGDGGPATSAQISYPTSVWHTTSALDLSDPGNSVTRCVSNTGTISTCAGTGSQGFIGDGTSNTINLTEPEGLAVNPGGLLYIADSYATRIRRVNADGSVITIAGGGSGDGIQAAASWLNEPEGIAFDTAGNMYIADTWDQRVRRVAPTGIISTVAGTGLRGDTGVGGPATATQLAFPSGVAAGPGGVLYIADSTNSRVLRVSAAGTSSLFAGGNGYGSSGDGGPATAAQLAQPADVAVDSTGNVYIADGGSYRVRRVATNGIISTYAGNGVRAYSGDGGQATAASLGQLAALAVDTSDNLFIADAQFGVVRRVATNGIITTVAGNGTPGFSGDGGSATAAQLGAPLGVAAGPGGNLYIADRENLRIRRVNAAGVISTIAGGNWGFSGDGGPAIDAGTMGSYKLALDTHGDIYFCDQGNWRIRRLTTVGALAAEAGSDVIIAPGQSTTLSGFASGGTPPYTYAWQPATGLSDAHIPNPVASPATTTTYMLTVTDGASAHAADSVTVTIAPALITSAGADVVIRQGGAATLNGGGTGGVPPYSSSWQPTTGLSAGNVGNPVASPTVTTTYTLTLTDAIGQTSQDSVIVSIAPALGTNAGSDATIAAGAGTRLNGSPIGGVAPYVFTWSPAAGLNLANVADPTASPATTTTYTLTITDSVGQTATDTVIITVTGGGGCGPVGLPIMLGTVLGLAVIRSQSHRSRRGGGE